MKRVNNQPTDLEKKLTKIANNHILELKDRKSLKAYYSDADDFFETSVWSLEAALKAAYELGKSER
jgi:hypothetical protein